MSATLEELEAAMHAARKAQKATCDAYCTRQRALYENAGFTFEALKELVAIVERAIPILGPGHLPEYGTPVWELCVALDKARGAIETVEGREQ